MSALERVGQIREEAEAAHAASGDSAALEEVRVRYLGRRAELPNLLRGVAQLDPAERAATGRAANEARQALERAIEERSGRLAAAELTERLTADRVDVTLPGDPAPHLGRLHLLTQTWREIEDIFIGLGFDVAEGPEVETVHLNFDVLNAEPTHPSRLETDTFYLASDPPRPFDLLDPETLLLRTQTSPVQVRAMRVAPPPLYVIAPGRVYRPDSAVDEGVTLADLQGTLLEFARAIFGPEREVRMRPHFFPFTEPSVEVDVSCFACVRGILPDGGRCPLCKGTAWIEILGAGMIDPNVLSAVGDPAYDPELVSGFAFGMGIDRIAMLKHGVTDLRLMFDNDLRFLEQF
jgi:phenylalanyl-tRNA synthetase alpha chain